MPPVVVPASLPELAAALQDALAGPADDAPVVALRPLLHAAAPLPTGGALVVRTSGSTGDAREVVLPRAALLASIGATARRLGGHGRWLLALPWEHVAGAQVVARAVVSQAVRGGDLPCAALPDVPFTPDAFADAAEPFLDVDIGDGASPAYLSLVPTQLHRLLTDAATDAVTDPAGPEPRPGGRALAALRRFDAVLLGGAAVAPDLLSRARAARVRVVTTYGMSETCGGCVYDGRPLDGVRVELDGDGRVLLRGPMVAAGYLGDPGTTAAAFGDGPDRFFRTSDLGAFADDGRLRVLGRADDVVVTGGEKVAPLAVEHALTAAADLWKPPLWPRGSTPEVCVVGVPDAEWGQAVVAVVVDPAAHAAAPAPDALRTAVRAAVTARASSRAAPRHVVVVPSLPLRGPGKIDRTGLAALVRDVVGRTG
ncbi:AMP-binding protein [Luteimicrobium subarcticum]|uniref:O-succinylbenzoic acid--CoA ligase n=1 Tax=Luteimicrobium subarcticum TaxID=620910 RepID=A0A2M8WVR1_9MICO|nr:AMP-binding protein [Luteimicrobium subarcticum]PJI95010.1 O-succinylbenzoic acid--CoA ligase [Luteimicrobium subarcticum]